MSSATLVTQTSKVLRFQAHSHKQWKSPVIFDMSVRPSIDIYQCGFHWTDFRAI